MERGCFRGAVRTLLGCGLFLMIQTRLLLAEPWEPPEGRGV